MITYLSQGSGAIAMDHQTGPGLLSFQDIHCYNEFFLSWHREYIREMEEWLLTQNGGSKFVPLPYWEPTSAVPCEFFNNTCATCPGNAVVSGFGTLFNQNPSGYNFNRFLTSSTLCSYTSGFETPPQFGKPPRFGTAVDNFAWDLQWEHNGPHVSIGGVMAQGTSPAAAIFWLWHAYVDELYCKYQCDCQGRKAKDLYIADSNEDIGNEPNTETNNIIYSSPEIWVRNNQDALGVDGRYSQQDNPNRHQNPEAGQTNYIYVRVRNIGCQTLNAGEVDLQVYYSKASTGLNWPVNWINYVVMGQTRGDEITITPIAIPTLNPGEQYVAEIPWSPPSPSTFGEIQSHFCLLSRLTSGPASDPMGTETSSIGANTRNNNNIAWKNVNIVDLNPFMLVDNLLPQDPFIFEVIQAPTINDPIKLTFKNTGDIPLDRLVISANFGVMDTFLKAGTFVGIDTFSSQQGELAFMMKGDSGSIENLMLPSGASVPIRLNFELQCSPQGGTPCANYGDIIRYNVEQFTQGVFGDGFVGGVSYDIRIVKDSASNCGPLIANTVINDASCENHTDGSILLNMITPGNYTYFWSNGANTQLNSSLLPGRYAVTVVDSNSCSDTMSFVIQDKSDLKVNIESNAAYCGAPNGSLKAIVSGGFAPYSYQWSNGSQDSSIHQIGPKIYELVVTDNEGCKRSITTPLGMRMILGGQIGSTPASGSNVSDGSVYIVPTGGIPPYSYSWSNGALSDTVKNVLSGDYSVTITDSQGCTFVDTVMVDFGNSIEELEKDNHLSVMPNPTSGELHLSFYNWLNGNVLLTLTNLEGKTVMEINEQIVQGSLLINVQQLPAGVYFLRAIQRDKSISTKIIKVN